MDPTAPNNNNPSASATPPETPPKPGVSATVIDPNDPLVGQVNPNVAQSGPILPGQYVVAGSSGSVASDPPIAVPQPESPSPLSSPPPLPVEPSMPDPAAAVVTPFSPPSTPPEPVFPAAPLGGGETLAPPVPIVPMASSEQPSPLAAPAPNLGQPDPTPFSPPPAPSAAAQVSGSSSMIKKLRLLAIVLGGLVLVGVIGALAWYFLLGNQKPPAKTDAQSQSVDLEPSPLPKRTDGGFGVLPPIPQSSGSAVLESTQSAPPLQ